MASPGAIAKILVPERVEEIDQLLPSQCNARSPLGATFKIHTSDRLVPEMFE
jgi:hypothetical protein